jgi:hypothetical protein
MRSMTTRERNAPDSSLIFGSSFDTSRKRVISRTENMPLFFFSTLTGSSPVIDRMRSTATPSSRDRNRASCMTASCFASISSRPNFSFRFARLIAATACHPQAAPSAPG